MFDSEFCTAAVLVPHSSARHQGDRHFDVFDPVANLHIPVRPLLRCIYQSNLIHGFMADEFRQRPSIEQELPLWALEFPGAAALVQPLNREPEICWRTPTRQVCASGFEFVIGKWWSGFQVIEFGWSPAVCSWVPTIIARGIDPLVDVIVAHCHFPPAQPPHSALRDLRTKPAQKNRNTTG